MRVGSFDSGQQAANPESPQHLTGHALATIVAHLSNQNSQRNIFLSLNVTEAWELVYIIHH